MWRVLGAAALLVLLGWPARAQDMRGWPVFEPPPARRPPPAAGARPPPPVKRSDGTPSGRTQPPTKPRTVAPGAAWRVLRLAWTPRDEAGFEEFVQRIGESNCRSVHACLTSPQSNPLYQASNPPGMTFYADCADLPYVLRAYYAWKNGLPFSYATTVTPLGPSHDIRYTARGNQVVDRRDLVGRSIDAGRALRDIVDVISSAQYRYPPEPAGRLLPDHYPVRITRGSIKPGTIVYDANGHVAVVYKVTDEGRIHYMDTHPDGSLTRSVYGRAFSRASPAMGAGFKRWRPQTLVGAAKASDGSYEGGRVEIAGNRSIADWSDEQFYGTAPNPRKSWRTAKFVFDGQITNFHEYVRKSLARAGFKYDPIDETRSMVRTLCRDLEYRVEAVDIAVKAGIHLRPQPDRLPNNIYATDGDWEIYSTPSRDARLKTQFKELRDEIARFLALAAAGGKDLAYAGGDLRSDLLEAYAAETRACSVTYVRTDGSAMQVSFEEIAKRLFALSFDPHHCIERRWGATEASELSTCPDARDKQLWYEAEQRLRNQPERTYDVRMGFSLADLKRRAAGSGIDAPPDIDVRSLLADPSR